MIFYTKISNNYAKEAISELTLKTIETQNSALEFLTNDISDYSKEIISNQHTQGGVLDNVPDNKLLYNRLDKEIAASVIFNHKVSSAYIFDFRGNKYFRDKRKFKTLLLEDIRDQEWYEDIKALKGGYYLTINAGGLVDDVETDYITMFRIVNSNNTHLPMGLLMVNVEINTIKEALNIEEDSALIIRIDKDSSVEDIIIGELPSIDYNQYLDKNHDTSIYFGGDQSLGSETYRISGYNNSDYEWQLIHIENVVDKSDVISSFNLVFLLIMGVIGLTIFYGSIYISKYISNPIIELTKIMENVEAEKFDEVYLGGRQDEIGKLGDGYNYMIARIKELINTIIVEQEAIKEAELRVLMEQVKPHFIYNTLDSISSLVANGQNEEANSSLTALGKFYRASLSDGNLIVELKTELEIVKNYLFIQQIRYKDLFEAFYDIDENLMNYKVPKLILQPLVENSLYHGIRPIGMDGEITIQVVDEEDSISMSVIDNGCGMKEEVQNYLNSEEVYHEENKKSSVGLPATMRRIRSRYGIDSQFTITSNNNGTKVTIRIPKEKINEL